MAKDDKKPEADKAPATRSEPETSAQTGGMAVAQAPVPAAEAFAGRSTVTMVFPRPVRLQYKPGQIAVFNAGVQEVPVDLARHPYLQDHGVKPYVKPAEPAPAGDKK